MAGEGVLLEWGAAMAGDMLGFAGVRRQGVATGGGHSEGSFLTLYCPQQKPESHISVYKLQEINALICSRASGITEAYGEGEELEVRPASRSSSSVAWDRAGAPEGQRQQVHIHVPNCSHESGTVSSALSSP